MQRGRFVGIGVDRYASSDLDDLNHPVSDVAAVHRLLGDGFDGQPLANPKEGRARRYLKAVKSSFGVDGGVLIAMWSGHGVSAPTNGGVRLMAANSDADAVSGLSPADVIGPCALSGGNQILLIVDTCFSGEALSAAIVADALYAARPPGGRGAWVGVLSASSAIETASDGVLAAHPCKILRDGPTDAELRRRWSAHNRLIRGDDLCDAVVKEWPESAHQRPGVHATGTAWEMLRNPLWVAGAPAVVVEHLLLAARGGAERAEESWFTGRAVEVDEVVTWVTGGAAGVFLVTGSAGTGKSAIVGRVVSLSVPGERARLLAEDPEWGHTDPGQGSVAAHAHARGVTVNRLAEQLDYDLTRAGVLTGSDTGPRNGNELLGAVERAHDPHAGHGWRPPVLVVDGLDEARDQTSDIATDLLVRLARWCTVIVSTRNRPPLTDTGPDLLDTLNTPVHRLDLDDPAVAARGRDAIREYIAARLTGVSTPMDPALVAGFFLTHTSAVTRSLSSVLRHPDVRLGVTCPPTRSWTGSD